MDYLQKLWAQRGFVGNPSLREVLHQPPVLIENYNKTKQFFCKAAVDKLLDRPTVSTWIKTHPLHRKTDNKVSDEDLIDRIVSKHRLLFAVLVAAELESFTFAILTQDQSDKLFPPEINYERLNLSFEERQRLESSLQKVSLVLSKNEHKRISMETVLPLTKREKTDLKGSFGQIYKVEFADGHLEGYSQNVVAEKLIYLNKLEQEKIAFREVETLRAREHPNIVPLLASYSMKRTASDSVAPLHLIFPWTDQGNLADWMNSCDRPSSLQNATRLEQQKYLYRCMYALVSGLSSLHHEKDYTITAHHDLKPENILVFGKEMKIADFGRSHLHSSTQGSQTDGKNGLGTYDYQPPEYYQDNGARAEIKHGRAFDIWSMGCIIVQLATLIVYGWEEKVAEFRKRRLENSKRNIPKLRGLEFDSSFHNNRNIVDEWVALLKRVDRSQEMESTLKIALQMMNQERNSRLFAWEAELDLYKILPADDNRDAGLEKGAPCVQGPPQRKIANGTQTPLHRAAETGDSTRYLQLVEAGWSLSDTDSEGLTPWAIFEQNQPTEVCNALHAELYSDIPAKARSDKIASEELVPRYGSSREHGQELLKAAAQGELNTVRDLIQKGVDIMFVDEGNRSALYKAVENNQCIVVDYLVEIKGEELLRLKENSWRDTPLHKAASMGHATIIKRLLRFHSNIEDKQKQGKTALFLATEWGREKAVNVLLDHGAQVFTKRDLGGTPLHAAASGNYPEILKRLLQAPGVEECLEHKNQYGDTPLWFALINERVNCANILLEHGASLHVSNNDNSNVIHVTVMKRLYDFLERNINRFREDEFTSRNRWNDTPLMLAQKDQKPSFIELLTRYTYRDRGFSR